MNNDLVRIGIFYDGSFFSKVSRYYRYYHERRSRISIQGFHNFVRNRIAEAESTNIEMCQVVDAHYFRGRFSAGASREHHPDALFNERIFDDVLMRAGVITHYLPMRQRDNRAEEKGIDVWLALEAFELAIYKRFSVLALVAGDGDFLPLIRKLNTLGTKMLLLAWDFEYQDIKGRDQMTRTAQTLIDESTYILQMDQIVDSRSSKTDPFVNNLFLTKPISDERKSASRKPTFATTAGSSAANKTPEVGAEVTGSIKKIVSDNGYGFISGDDGNEYFLFYRNLVDGRRFEDFAEGDRVSFTVGKSEEEGKKPPALDVRCEE